MGKGFPQGKNVPNGPIPGENYTSDTRNYPWHRPPEITDLDKGIEAVIKQLSTKQGAYGLLNSLQAGVTVAQATEMLITSGIGKGKWAPDLGLILAGPVARMMEIMAKDAGITFAMGLDDDPLPTINVFEKQHKLSSQEAIHAGQELRANADILKTGTEPEEVNPMPETKGFMSKPNSDITKGPM